ncbi:MAG TPA: sulfite exporter TauE/SafE family protein [Acetobacteraceae bacterium]|nr:sulfite exporter TauE/SafE family protein [Acetobacteraceae bacterium]
MPHVLLLSCAGLLAGAMNALAGGGTFVTLPALIAAGVPSVQANASSTVALYPGGLASAWTYHERLGEVAGLQVRRLLGVTLAGGLAGGVLLLCTPGAAFDLILPWLLLVATLALAFGRRVGVALRGRLGVRPGPVLAMQFGLGVYGGYFGGAVGLMMVAFWCVLGERDIKALNAPRTLLVSAANTIAMLIFVVAGAVRWPQALVLLAGGVVGGYGGARLGRVLPAGVVRALTLCGTAGITAVFFVRAYLATP